MFKTVGTIGTAGTNETVLVCSPLVDIAARATPVRSNICAAWSSTEAGFQRGEIKRDAAVGYNLANGLNDLNGWNELN